MVSTSFRVIDTPDSDPVYCIALEEALHLDAETTGIPCIRIWRSEPAIVMGCSRRTDEDIFLENCRNESIPVLRRHSGGGTVYINPDVLNYTIIVPYFHPDLQPLSRIRESLIFCLNPVIEALKPMGIEADIKRYGDLCVSGMKFGGCAQARKRKTILHHGTVMLDDRAGEMERYLRIPPERRDIPHTDFVTGLHSAGFVFDEVLFREMLITEWARLLNANDIRCEHPAGDVVESAVSLARRKYSSEAYNLRR